MAYGQEYGFQLVDQPVTFLFGGAGRHHVGRGGYYTITGKSIARVGSARVCARVSAISFLREAFSLTLSLSIATPSFFHFVSPSLFNKFLSVAHTISLTESVSIVRSPNVSTPQSATHLSSPGHRRDLLFSLRHLLTSAVVRALRFCSTKKSFFFVCCFHTAECVLWIKARNKSSPAIVPPYKRSDDMCQ